MCSAGGCHRFHLRCALDGLVRLQGCPICRHPQGHRATIAQDVVDNLEERRVAANLPRPLPAPVTLDDWDIDEMLAATGCPLPPQGVQARCCFRTVAWAPLAERSRPDAAPTGWTPGWTCTACAAFIPLPPDWTRRRPRCPGCAVPAIGTARLDSRGATTDISWRFPCACAAQARIESERHALWTAAYGPRAWHVSPDPVRVSWLFTLAHAQLVHGIQPEQLGYTFDAAAWNVFVDGVAAYALIASRDLTHPSILDMPGHLCTAWQNDAMAWWQANHAAAHQAMTNLQIGYWCPDNGAQPAVIEEARRQREAEQEAARRAADEDARQRAARAAEDAARRAATDQVVSPSRGARGGAFPYLENGPPDATLGAAEDARRAGQSGGSSASDMDISVAPGDSPALSPGLIRLIP